jgi:hypothetical protein
MALTNLAQLPANANPNAGDQFKQVLAYVPSEVVALYVSGDAWLRSLDLGPDKAFADPLRVNLGYCIIGISALLVPAIILIANSKSKCNVKKPILAWRVFAGLISFAIWVGALVGKSAVTFPGVPAVVISAAAGLGLIVAPIVLQQIGSLFDGNSSAGSDADLARVAA